MIDIPTAATAILMVFYLYLGVRWQYVRRPWCYFIGAIGLTVLLAAQLFGLGQARGLKITEGVFQIIGMVTAFKCAVGAVYGGKIPIWDAIIPPKTDEASPSESA